MSWQRTAERVAGAFPHVPRGILAFLRSGWAETYPAELARAEGAHAFTADGRRYVDWTMGKGPVILGHAREEIDRAAFERARRGLLLPGIAPEYEALAARLSSLVPAMESIAFTKNGSDAVSIAIRLARVHTGRDWILSAGYHGWDERVRGESLAASSPSRSVADFAYDLGALEDAVRAHGDRVAAVLVTPEPAFFGPELLRACAQLAERCGAVLIADEVRCGMRLAPGGAHEAHGVRPDLVTMSKGLANGWPIAAVGGRREVMEASAQTFVFGTHYAEAAALAASLETLRIAEEERALERLREAGEALSARMAGAFAERGVAARVLGPPSMPTFLFADPAVEDAFYAEAARAGVLFFQDDAQCPSAVHGAVVEETVQLLEPVIASLAGGPRELSGEALERYAARRMIAKGAFDLAAVHRTLR